jgi:uncharacterized protein (DUF1330 family)/DNA-binding transcriptional regulator YhcF (GntR family)
MMAAYAVAHLNNPTLHPDVFEYLERIQDTLNPFAGRFIVHGGEIEVIEGEWPGALVVLEFPSIGSARDWYESPAYREILPLRTGHIASDTILAEASDPTTTPRRWQPSYVTRSPPRANRSPGRRNPRRRLRPHLRRSNRAVIARTIPRTRSLELALELVGLRCSPARPMDLHLALDRGAPVRAQLERELRDAIRAGRLHAGSKLPPSRVLADELQVSRGVVVEAYSQLMVEGDLVARPGDGTRIAEAIAQQPPAARAPAARVARVRYDLRSGVPTCRSSRAVNGRRRRRGHCASCLTWL